MAASVNLDTALRLPKMEELLSNNDKVEVAINLDQNVGFQVVWIAFSF